VPKYSAGGIELPHAPYLIGAGVCKTLATTREWLKLAPVVSGSYTKNRREGNPGRVVYPDSLEKLCELRYGLNSYGLPNIGFQEAAKQLSQIDKRDQPLVVSVAGFSVAEYVEGVRVFSANKNTDAIELNFGCPNTQDEDCQDIISFNPTAVGDILTRLVEGGLTKKPIWLKFSPYSNPTELQRTAELVNCFGERLRCAVVTCNAFPNAYGGPGKISPNMGLSGLSGHHLRPIALGQVLQFRHYLKSTIDVIGVGGITTGNDIIDFMEAGAAAVQLNSLAYWAGPKFFHKHLFKEETADRFLKLLRDNLRVCDVNQGRTD